MAQNNKRKISNFKYNMSNKPGRERSYTWLIKRPINKDTLECNSFRDYVRENLSRGRTMNTYEVIADVATCAIRVVFTCWSCGASGPERFRRNLLVEFPDADAEELLRKRV